MASIQGIYVALFGRPADPSGLAYFNGVTKNGADLSGIGDLTKTSEYQSRFTGMSNEQVVNSIYKSLFGRDGEKTGIDFFLAKLASGELTINNIAIAILDGARGDDLVTVKAKIDAANIFTSHLDLQLEIDAYRGNTAAQIGRDFITAVTKTDPGTAEKADAAILKVVQNQGQAPVGDTGTGGSIGGGTQTTFEIHKSAPPSNDMSRTMSVDGISFGGNATGVITLGQTGGMEMPMKKMVTPVDLLSLEPTIDWTPKPSLLTGERSGVVATFPEGSVAVNWAVQIANKALPADLVLKDNLRVSMDAETASTHEIGGQGSVCISGSAGAQAIHVTASGRNSIEGGLGADTIDIESGSSGVDNIRVNGVTDLAVRTVLEAASAARDAVDARTALNKAVEDLAVAEKETKEAKITLQVAEAADKVADALSKAVSLLDKEINKVFAFLGVNQITLLGLRTYIETSKIIPQDLKTNILDAIPDVKDFKLASFLDKVHSYIDEYQKQADNAKANAQTELNKANDKLDDAQAKKIAAADAETSENKVKSDADLAHAKEIAESAVEPIKHDVHTDSDIGHEDKVFGFDIKMDNLILPSHKIVTYVKQSFSFGDKSYNVDVVNGIGHVTDASNKISVALSGDLLNAALKYLSNDNVVKQGETVAFDYMDGNETGLYVFQGGDYGSDIGVKLVGLHAPDTTPPGHGLAELLGFNQPV